MSDSQRMIIGTAYSGPYGLHPGAWRAPWARPDTYTDIQAAIRSAQAADRGDLDFVFYPDRVFLWGDVGTAPPLIATDPLMTLAAIAPMTKRVGLVASASTSFMEPYSIARQFRALDVMSHGRAGWNAIPSYEPEAFANYGLPVPAKDAKYERLHETIQITQALWASGEREAGAPDPASGRFADPRRIRPMNLQGRHVGSRGPLQIPPSEQGQPVIFMPFASGHGIQAAGMYADAVIAMPPTLEAGQSQRATMRAITERAGRQGNDAKHLTFVSFGVGRTTQEAVQRRMALEEAAGIESRLAELSRLLGIRLDAQDADDALSADQLSRLRPHPGVPKSEKAVRLAGSGLTPREMLGHGVLDQNPGLVGAPEDIADFLQQWIQQDATDGFLLVSDDEHDSHALFSDLVVPELRRRGLRPETPEGTTLRDRLGIPEQFGVDLRIAGGEQK